MARCARPRGRYRPWKSCCQEPTAYLNRKLTFTTGKAPCSIGPRVALSSRRAIQGLERRHFLRFKVRLALQQSHAAVPAKNRIVVAGRMASLRLAETLQGPLQ